MIDELIERSRFEGRKKEMGMALPNLQRTRSLSRSGVACHRRSRSEEELEKVQIHHPPTVTACESMC
jgi:hypothetical protein